MKIAIVGGGKAAVAMLNFFSQSLQIEIIGICDPNQSAPGVLKAKEMGIPYFAKIPELLKLQELNAVFELTGVQTVLDEIQANTIPGIEILSSRVARIIFGLIDTTTKHSEVQENIKKC
jgi:methyl-accepting chemotaxis protein